MAIDDNIRDEKLKYGINTEAAEILTLSSGKIDKYKYLTGEEILPQNQIYKLYLQMFLLGNHLKNKQKRLNFKVKNK